MRVADVRLAQNLAIFNFRLFREEPDTDQSQQPGQSILDVANDLVSQLFRKLEVLSGKNIQPGRCGLVWISCHHVVVVENSVRGSGIVAAWKDEAWHKTIELDQDQAGIVQAEQAQFHGRFVAEHRKLAGWISPGEVAVKGEMTFSSGGEQVLDPPAKHVESGVPKTMLDSKHDVDGAKLAEVGNQIREMKSEISAVVAENHRLQQPEQELRRKRDFRVIRPSIRRLLMDRTQKERPHA